ncbi:hypothetical protein SPHV1_50060 [Novosphingobium sp. KN65.2]|nr:hypothetical protein SPHV1_50060 [Novosphingobium sp. KN65.2]
MAQGPDFPAGDSHRAHTEETQLLERAAIEFLDDVPSPGTLDLEAPDRARNRFAHGSHRRTIVKFELDIVALLGLITQPVRRRSAADVAELFGGEPEDDPIADDMAVRRGRHILLGLIDRPPLGRIDHRIGQKLEGIFSADVQIHHVVGLIEQNRAVLPGPLFRTPVREFRRHDRIDVSPQLRIAQHLDGTTRALQNLLKIHGHLNSPTSRAQPRGAFPQPNTGMALGTRRMFARIIVTNDIIVFRAVNSSAQGILG